MHIITLKMNAQERRHKINVTQGSRVFVSSLKLKNESCQMKAIVAKEIICQTTSRKQFEDCTVCKLYILGGWGVY